MPGPQVTDMRGRGAARGHTATCDKSCSEKVSILKHALQYCRTKSCEQAMLMAAYVYIGYNAYVYMYLLRAMCDAP